MDNLLKWLPNIAALLLIICYAPQIYSNAKYKNPEGINVWFFIILIASLGTFLAYNILLFIKFGVWMGIITEGVNVLLAVVVLIQIVVYRKKDTHTVIKPVTFSIDIQELSKALEKNKPMETRGTKIPESRSEKLVPKNEVKHHGGTRLTD